MDLSSFVGPAIRRFRQEANLTQEELAAKADLDRTYISGVERNKRNPTVSSLQAIVAAMGTGLDALFNVARELATESKTKSRSASSRRKAK